VPTVEPIQAPVIARLEAMPGVWQVHLSAPGLAARANPGQFVMVLRGESYDPFLRASAPLHRIGRETVALLVDEGDPEMGSLVRLELGYPVDLLGPLGHGFDLGSGEERLLLIGQGLGITPLVGLGERAVELGKQVTLVHHTDLHDGIYPAGLLPNAIEYRTLVGEAAEGTLALDELLLALLPQVDRLCVSGPMEWIRRLRQRIAEDPLRDREGWAQAYVQAKMGCGLGLCSACAIKVQRGIRRVCTDGPVLDLYEIA
jgi:dihydroorotate dehydrogenase electron transfer subunit